MTMQVGMVGTNGVLIASDTRWMNPPMLRENQFWAGGRHTFNSPKITICHERGLAISCAKDMNTARHVANEIIRTMKDEDLRYPISSIETIGASVLRSAEQPNPDAQCLIAFAHPVAQLFLFQFATVNGQRVPACQQMGTFAIAGDNINPAIYWPERYYQKLPIERLVPLAAHTIIAAHKLFNGAISGLEIVLCDASGVHRLSDDSIGELELKANEWDKEIGGLFLNHQQQFTYAPHEAG